MEFHCVFRSHVGLRRATNEDAVLCRADLGLWAIADGMGGHDSGEVASAMVVDRLGADDLGLGLAVRTDAARRVLTDVNERLVALARTRHTGRTIGTTVVAIIAVDQAFACLWTGDSRAYRARAGAIARLTRDHSLVQTLIDAGEIDPAEAAAHPGANIVTRAVGAAPTLDVEIVRGDIGCGDTLLLASDGLTRLLSDEELLTGLQAPHLDDAADEFIDLCLSRGAPDNVSFVIVRAGEPR